MKLYENKLEDIALHIKTIAYMAGVKPETIWKTYISKEEKGNLKWKDIKRYLNDFDQEEMHDYQKALFRHLEMMKGN